MTHILELGPLVMPVAVFQEKLREQGVDRIDYAFICPLCGTVQSARDLIQAGAGKTFEEVEKLIGWDCVGRYSGAPAPRKLPDGKPCNWTLGGLLKLHTLEVEASDGKRHPFFEPTSPIRAQRHAKGHADAAD